ncbi:MAG: pilin [Candidatus Saccharimonadales bacterium]
MLKTIKTLIVASFVAVIAAPVAVPVLVHAQGESSAQKLLCKSQDKSNTSEYIPSATGNSAADGNCSEVDNAGAEKLNQFISQVVNVISLIVGIAAVIMIIIGGFKYITSGGDSGAVTGAKNTILYAIIGLVIVALAQFIVRFVTGKATTGTS